jgi:outer membrane protein assembly factor BamB
MRTPRSARALVVAATALLLLSPTAAVAHDDDHATRDRDRGLPTSYLLDPAGQADPNIFPEGVAVRGDTFFVGSTTDGTIYRGDVREPTATPFLLAGNAEGRTSAVGMKVDGRTLLVAGGATGQVFAYDIRSGELTGHWSVADPTDAANPTFLNDLAVDRRGNVYVTDSNRPVLYRIDARDRRTDGVQPLPTFVDFTGTALQYQPGFNVNGLVVSPDDRYVVVAQTNTGMLFRVGVRDRSVTPVDLGGQLVHGDGLLLRNRTLYAVDNAATPFVARIELERGFTEGEVVSRTADPSFRVATTMASVGRSLLVVNSQFGATDPGPFTVSRIPAP